MSHSLKEGDRVNVYIGWGKHAETKVGTILIHDAEGGYWSSRPYLVRLDDGVEDWYDYTSLTHHKTN